MIKNHPRRCKAKFKRDPDRKCGNFAMIGVDYCKFHGGPMQKKNDIVRLRHLPVFYSDKLKGTLQEAVQRALEDPPSEQVEVFEELALFRVEARRIVGLYSAAMQSDRAELQTEAAELMKKSLAQVVKIAESAARIRSMAVDKFSVFNLSHIVAQIVRIAYKVFEDDIEKAQLFEQLVRDEVRLAEEQKGVDFTTADDVKEMDNSVPQV